MIRAGNRPMYFVSSLFVAGITAVPEGTLPVHPPLRYFGWSFLPVPGDYSKRGILQKALLSFTNSGSALTQKVAYHLHGARSWCPKN
ncbi:MAG: hypothetical protein E4H16_01310 [Candidatus Atribacteria bacterium]|nr:MAG: hypothetical protein E4H16_01310 [Candidatus Atribacteria bacterium]